MLSSEVTSIVRIKLSFIDGGGTQIEMFLTATSTIQTRMNGRKLNFKGQICIKEEQGIS